MKADLLSGFKANESSPFGESCMDFSSEVATITPPPEPWPSSLFFAHGNGFPARSYTTLLRALSPRRLRYVPCLGLGMADVVKQKAIPWSTLLRQLYDYLPQKSSPVVGLGHSLGAVLILQAYYARRSSFSKLVLMDPPLFGWGKQLSIRLFQSIGRADRVIAPARKAKRRRMCWRSYDEAKEYLKTRPLLSRFHPQALEDYLRHGLCQTSTGYTLRLPREVEYRIFCGTPWRLRFMPIDVPCYVLYSAEYQACSPKDVRYLSRQLPAARFVPMAGGHMFPLEQPRATAQLIQSLLG